MSAHATLSDTDSIFARAYANAIKKKFQLDVGEHYEILTSPVTQRGPAAGDLIYRQMTNYLIYKVSDCLQYSDNPSYTGGSAGSYVQQLTSYLNWVTLKGDRSQAVADRMNKALMDATAANDTYFAILEQAIAQYGQVKYVYSDPTFWEWTQQNYPPLGVADYARKAAQTEVYQAMQQYYGPDASTLSTSLTHIMNAQSPLVFPGYNMDGLIDDHDLVASAIKNANDGIKLPEPVVTQSTIRVPAYNIPTYVSSVQAWITAAANGATRDQIIEIDIDEGRNANWEDFGFHSIRSRNNQDYWPFFSADVPLSDRKWKSRRLDTSGRENGIRLRLAMIGVQQFNVRVGEWDVANVKALFPVRLPDAPNVLSPDFARIVSILVGYDVELRVDFAPEMREDVDKMYQTVGATGGVLTIFGFRVFAGEKDESKEQVDTKFDDIQWNKDTGSMVLTPTAGQVYPTILGVIAQRFD